MQRAQTMRALSRTGAGKIEHVVYIVQENRSFNNLFQGYPGAYTVASGKNSKGGNGPAAAGQLGASVRDRSRRTTRCSRPATGRAACRERTAGWMDSTRTNSPAARHVNIRSTSTCRTTSPNRTSTWRVNGCVADHMFQSHLDESFVAHQYAIAAQAQSSADFPAALGMRPGRSTRSKSTIRNAKSHGHQEPRACFDYQTLGDELDAGRALLAVLHELVFDSPSSGQGFYWSGYQAVKHIYEGPDWRQTSSRRKELLLPTSERASSPNFTWITPVCRNSDHANCGGGFGPSWVASLVNAVGESKFWDTTAIFVHLGRLGRIVRSRSAAVQDFDGLGFRVPLLVISPYAKRNHVSHVQYETASVLRFAEDLFGLDAARRGATRARRRRPATASTSIANPAPFHRDQGAEEPALFRRSGSRPPHPRLRMKKGRRNRRPFAVANCERPRRP